MTVVEVIGEVDLGTIDELDQALTQALTGDPVRVVVDMNKVDFLGSVGLSALVKADTHATASGVALLVVSTARVVRRAFEVTGLDQRIPVLDTLDHVLTGTGGDEDTLTT